MTHKTDIESLYADIQIRHALTARMRLETMRSNMLVDDVLTAPEMVREAVESVDVSVEFVVCAATMPSLKGVVK